MRSEALQEGRKDDEKTSTSHASTATEVVGERPSEKETRDDGTKRVCRIDESDQVGVGVVEPFHPVIRALYSIIDRGIVSVEHHAGGSDERDVPIPSLAKEHVPDFPRVH